MQRYHCDRIIGDCYTPGTEHLVETMEKTKTRPDIDNKSGHVSQSGHSLFLEKHHIIRRSLIELKSGKMDRKDT